MDARDADAFSRVTTGRLVLRLRRGVLASRLDEARDACAEAVALRREAEQIVWHAAAVQRRRRELTTRSS
jgi:hypothetical protein